MSDSIDWKAWWNSYAFRTDGVPPRVRDSARADLEPAARDALKLLLHPEGDRALFSPRNCDGKLRVLDIGSGPGHLSLEIRDLLAAATGIPVELVLSDIAPKFLESCKGGPPSVALDSARLPFRDESFDAVVAYSSIQYFQGTQLLSMAMAEIFRVLVPGGTAAICAYPDSAHRKRIVDGYAKVDMPPEMKAERSKITAGQLWLSRDRMLTIAKKAGFSETSVSDMDPALWESSYMFNLRGVKPSR